MMVSEPEKVGLVYMTLYNLQIFLLYDLLLVLRVIFDAIF